MSRIVLRPRARADLFDIWEYLEERSGETEANNFIRKIEQKLFSLANFPTSGRPRNELRPDYIAPLLGVTLSSTIPLKTGSSLSV